MEIIPAIDLINGECIRLYKGDYNQKTVYEKNPLKVIENFNSAGAKWVHIVDLDGAKDSSKRQTSLIKEMVLKYPLLKIETGGGIRSKEEIKTLLDNGITRVIIGSLCVKEPEKVVGFIKTFGEDKIVLGLDAEVKNHIPYVLTDAWQKTSSKTLFDLLDFYLDVTLSPTIISTDISKDGTLGGSNLDLYKQIKNNYKEIKLIASGGVSSMEDLENLNNLKVEYAITGKALYEKKIDLKTALERFK